MKIEIEVQGGKVTITVGGQSDSAVPQGDVQTTQGFAGAVRNADKKVGAGATDDTVTGGGGPLTGALVIGPVVIGCCCHQKAKTEGSGKTGAGATDDTVTGGGGPPSGTVVIGPILVGGCGGGATKKAGTATPTSQGISVDPKEGVTP